MLKVVLICGNGASSSFMATRLKSEIKTKNLAIEVEVRPETNLNSDIEQFDFILIGPHLDFLVQELSQKYHIKNYIGVIPYDIYATMDSSKLLDIILMH